LKIIQTENLTKSYKRFEKEAGLKGSIKSLFHRKFITKNAILNLNLEIDEGEFVGLIGPNGAGKTTLVKMLTGIIAPTSGDISVMGFYPNKLESAFKHRYAVVMGQKSQLFFELSAADTFLLFKEIYNIPDDIYKRNLSYFIDLFDVSEYLNVQVRTLSLGERMKMELIVALLHNPQVLFLDEPTIGLDAIAQKQIRKFLREVNKDKGTTIILTSHYMEDIRSLCSRCVVINSGSKIYDGALSSLLEKHQNYKKITVLFENETEIILPKNIEVIEKTNDKICFTVIKSESQAVLRSLISQYEITDISVEEEDIGNVVERIYQSGNQVTA
jgi:ABC-2 type transport system ATP-binding protein